MTPHHPRHREVGRAASDLLFSHLAPARAVLADVGAVAGILCALGVLPLAAAEPPAPSTSSTVTLDLMSDRDGLGELGDLARWRDVVLRFPTGHTETHRLLAIDGRLDRIRLRVELALATASAEAN